MPNSYRALMRGIIDATAYARKADNRKQIAAFVQGWIKEHVQA